MCFLCTPSIQKLIKRKVFNKNCCQICRKPGLLRKFNCVIFSLTVEKVVEPNRKQYPWYHQKFRRVPTIDQCYVDDQVCMFEANQQWKRDKLVDSSILSILRMRFEDCMLYEAPDHMQKCQPLMDTYNQASENWFIKCK